MGVAAEQVAGALPLAAGLPEVSTEEEREHWQGACARGGYWLLGCTFNPFMFSWDREVLIKYKVRLVTALHSTHGGRSGQRRRRLFCLFALVGYYPLLSNLLYDFYSFAGRNVDIN